MYDPGQVFFFISSINVEKYTVNVADFMSVQWTCSPWMLMKKSALLPEMGVGEHSG